MDLMQRRRALMMGAKKSRLPPEYQEVEWIESTGTQWIDTGFYPSNNTRLKTSICFRDLSKQAFNFPFGSRTEAGVNEYEVCCAGNINLAMRSDFGKTDNRKTSTFFPQIGNFFTIDKNKSICHFGSISVENKDVVFRSTNSLALFATKYRSPGSVTPGELFIGMIANTTIWESDTVRHEFIPCYRKSDNKPGLYDLCGSICPLTNSPFYVNAGTGEFLVGPDVN
jgi:hypothetical protein